MQRCLPAIRRTPRPGSQNQQLAEGSPHAAALGDLVLDALRRCPGFIATALPIKVFPPLFSRYEPGMAFGAHVDGAIAEVRTALTDDHPSVVSLTGAYHNLLRMWAEV